MDDWSIRAAEISKLDGEAWDTEHEKFKDEWLDAYCKAFIEFAISRNWERDSAKDAAHELKEEAFIEAYSFDWNVKKAVEFDVMAVEMESE